MAKVTYSILTADGWEEYDDREEWRQRSKELMEERDMSQYNPATEGDAMEW